MKFLNHIIWLVCAAVAIYSAGCTADDRMLGSGDDAEAAIVRPAIRLSVSEMSMSQASRASAPMSPDEEKYVRTLAIFEFDNEGIHEKGAYTYHFIDFIAGTVDGVTGVGQVDSTAYGIVETYLDDIALTEYDKGTLCLVANVTEAQVKEFYDTYREPGQSLGRINLDRFKTWALPFVYMDAPDKDKYDESVAGHLKDMYMFGYFYGHIIPAKSGDIAIDLGRLASRLDISIVNETGEDIKRRFGYHFDNVCDSAYFFPIKMGLPPVSTGKTRTVICAGDDYGPVEGDPDYKVVPQHFLAGNTHLRYFYVAAHSAKDAAEATQLHLFYGRPIIDDEDMKDENGVIDYTGTIKVPLCNVHPSEADDVVNGYSLSRNTRYHFTIHIKPKPASAPSRSPSADPSCPPAQISDGSSVDPSSGASVVYGPTPGDITVYLPG